MIEPAETIENVTMTDPVTLENYAKILRDNGYMVTPRERRVIITANRAVSERDLQPGRPTGFMKWLHNELARTLILEAVDAGLVTFEREGYDPSMRGVVFKATAAFIKPKPKE